MRLRSAIQRSLSAVLALAGGCTLLIASRKPMQYDYVFRKGGPKAISEWGLTQVDFQPIADALGALAEIGGRNRQDSADACDGFYLVYHKLMSGWPGFTGYDPVLDPQYPNTEAERARRLDLLIYYCYSRVGGMERNRYIDDLYRRIEPPLSHPVLHKEWYEAGHDVKTGERN